MKMADVGSLWSLLLSYILVSVLSPVIFAQYWKPCPTGCSEGFNLGEYNVSLLPLNSQWPSVYYHSDDIDSTLNIPTFFNISICSPLTSSSQSCNGDHVCYTDDFRSFYSLAAHGTCKYKAEDRILTLQYNFGAESVSVFGNGNLSVTFICGPSIGYPEIIEGDPHSRSIDILWITSYVCRPSRSTQTETRCYIINHNYNNGLQASFIDLSGLIQKSGYEATSPERPDLLLNVSVCRPMMTNGPCNGAMVCLHKNDSGLTLPSDWTQPTILANSSSDGATPHYEGSDLVVTYPIIASGIAEKCKSAPYAKITFLCPNGYQDLGISIEFIDPKLCQINFLWVTMHACDIKNVMSQSCRLSTPYGASFDLKDIAEQTVTPQNSKYLYDLLPCSANGLNRPCGRTDDASTIRVTQTDTQSGVCVVLGQGNGKLRYIDNDLSLTYTLGDTCSNGLARTTIISFLCPDNIISNCSDSCVTFITEEHCVYEFQWITSAACNTEASSKCKFRINNIGYNFALLTEDTTSTYVAISLSSDTSCYLINPCGHVEVTNKSYTAVQYCNERKAPLICAKYSVCQIQANGSAIPMGVFNLQNAATVATIDHSVISVSTEPAPSNKSIIVQYICQTGSLLSSPVFISHYTSDIVEFHWYTSAACPQRYVTGSNCMVREHITGFLFNLTSLSSHTFHFNDSTNKYHYMIQVCSALQSNLSPSCGNTSAVCQESNTGIVSAGQYNSKLIYDNSMLKLKYVNGTRCSDGSYRQTTVVFLCDPSARDPLIHNVTEVRHCDYLIEIKTLLACPPAYQFKECEYFSSDGKSYNLMNLAKSNSNWQAEGSDGSVYFINVCRPLYLQGIGHCNPLSAVCRLANSKSEDLGYASTSTLHSDSTDADLVLTYTMKHTVTNANECAVVTTDIEFFCNHSVPVDSGPRHVSGGDADNPCHYIFHWVSRAACPVVNVTSKDCNVTDVASGYTFNLEPLRAHQQIYAINDTQNHAQYFLTICGALKKSDTACNADGIAGCQIDSNNNSHSTGIYASMTLTYDEGSINLVYTGGDSCSNAAPRRTEIGFVCDRNAGDDYYGAPKSVTEAHHCHYLFVWPTALACIPTTLECIAGGGAYDLRPLMQTRNWHIDTSLGNIVLGVCQPVSDSACTQSFGVGACSDVNNGTILGHVTGDLIVVDEGFIQLSYHNGAVCSSEGLRKVTVINFHCNRDVGVGAPVLVSSSDDCRVDLNWETAYACSQDSSSANWTITNPATGQVYNLTQLTPVLSANFTDRTTNTSYNYTVGLGGHHVPCGASNGNNVSICQTSRRHFVVARTSQPMLTITNGKVQVNYENGDWCNHPKKQRKAVIYFEYDPRPDFLEVLPEEECEYSFIVYTKLVHEKSSTVGIDCTLPNFPDLHWFTSHQTPPISLGQSMKLYFSVCLPVSSYNQVTGSGYRACSDVAGACLVHGSTVLNLGRPSSHHPPALAAGGNAVIITYYGGDSCGSSTYTTKLMLTCSNTTASAVPTLVYPTNPLSSSSCEYVIMWPSHHACPLAVPSTNVSATVCAIQDPSDGTVFDLEVLSNKTHVMDTSGHYIIGLCGPISNPPDGCGNSPIGICHYSADHWMPMTNSDHKITLVSHTPHSLDVVYSSGVSCNGGSDWLAIIRMYCSAHHSSNKPIFVSDSNCEIHFKWPTSALCISNTEACYASSPNGTFDLERLVSQTWQGNYFNGNRVLGQFNISVCRNLNPTANEGSHCFPGPAGICLQPDVTQSDTFLNLGYMTRSPVATSGGVVLYYDQGDSCEYNQTIATAVNLLCASDTNHLPKLTKITSCHYSIDWITDIACTEKTESNSSCVLEDVLSGIQYNFNSLAKNLNFSDNQVNYSVCLCPHNGCSHPRIFNTSSNTVLGYFQKMVVFPDTGPQVLFINGQSCPGNSHYSSTVFMRCDRAILEEKGLFVWDKGLSISECQKFFSWWTPLACPTTEVVCAVHKPGSQFYYNFNPLHAVDGYWTVTDSGRKYLINVCGAISNDEATGCGGNAAVCMMNSDHTYQDLGYVSTQSIIFNSNGNPEIHFHGPKIADSSLPLSVTIELICGLQSLRFNSKTSSSFHFEWYTTFACPDNSNVHTQKDCNPYTERHNAYTFFPQKIAGDYHVHEGDFTYHINFCEGASACTTTHSSVCRISGGRELSLGSSTSRLIYIDSYTMQVNMEGSDGNATIIVECVGSSDHDVVYRLDEMILENSYSTHDGVNTFFRMYTQKGCSFNQNGVPNASPSPSGTSNTPASHSTNKKGVVIGIIVLVLILCIVVLLIIVILRNKDLRQQIIQTALGKKSDEPVRYVRAKTNQSLLDGTSSDESEEENQITETVLGNTVMEDAPLLVGVKTPGRPGTAKLSDEELLDL